MTDEMRSDKRDYSYSKRPYDKNSSNLEATLLEENYSDRGPKIKSTRKRGSNPSMNLIQREERNGDDLTLRIYLDELHRPKHQPPSREEEIVLAERITNGDESC